jgi:hypothetical protein
MKNRKATMIPGQEMVSVAALLFATIIVFFFMLMLGGGVTEETQQSQELLEESVLTSNMLLNLLEMEDSEDRSYAYWIERSLRDSDDYAYTEPLISDWLEASMGLRTYNFYVKYEGDTYFEMSGYWGSLTVGELRERNRDARVNFIEVHLPSREGELVEVVLETW